MKLLIFGAGVVVGTLISTVVLCCVMIKNSSFDEDGELKAQSNQSSTETE